jgi:hypothetical protein
VELIKTARIGWILQKNRHHCLPSASISCHPPVFLAIRQYFSAIRQYFSLSASISQPSASISRYPPVFLAIRQYFLLSASISCYPPVFLAIRQYPIQKYLFPSTQPHHNHPISAHPA